MDGLLRAALSPLWFETLHPFGLLSNSVVSLLKREWSEELT